MDNGLIFFFKIVLSNKQLQKEIREAAGINIDTDQIWSASFSYSAHQEFNQRLFVHGIAACCSVINDKRFLLCTRIQNANALSDELSASGLLRRFAEKRLACVCVCEEECEWVCRCKACVCVCRESMFILLCPGAKHIMLLWMCVCVWSIIHTRESSAGLALWWHGVVRNNNVILARNSSPKNTKR